MRHPGSSVWPIRLLLLELLDWREYDLGALDANHGGAVGVLLHPVVRVAAKVLEVLDALDRQPDGTAAVHGRGDAALLHVSGDALSALKPVVGFLADDAGNELRVVDVAGLFVDKDQAARAGLALVLVENFLQVLDVCIEHLEADSLFGDVNGRGAHAEAAQRGDVARAPALGLDDEDAASGGGSGLLDLVAVVDQLVQARVRSQRVFGAGDVLRDGVERLEAANDEERIEFVLLDEVGNQLHAGLRGQLAVGANLGAALAGPAVDLEPVERPDSSKGRIAVMAGESGEAVVDSQRLVSAREAVGLVLVREFRISQAHGLVKIFGVDGNGDLLGLLDGLHKRLSHNLVLVDSNEAGLGLGGGLQHGLDSLNALQCAENAVVGHRGASSLHVSQGGDAGVEAEAALALVRQEIFDFGGGDLVAILITGTLCNDDDCLSLSHFPVLVKKVKIIVNGPDEADNVQVLIRRNLLRSELPAGNQFLEQRGPFSPELVGAGQGAVASADDEGVDAVEHHVLGCRQSARSFVKGHASSSSDERSALGQEASDIVPSHLPDEVAALHQTLVSLVDAKRIAAHVDRHADNGADNGVHARGVASRGHDGNLLPESHRERQIRGKGCGGGVGKAAEESLPESAKEEAEGEEDVNGSWKVF
ncbi:hypothetical protein Trco_006887 [Trichoderma cornu-damae]|uniref:Uncharacterized protein n=1 Tax=Trichoderma cornu-damae TaxID=654480 RepID=A0A9P8QFR6_9HYPO|nr:hypothetical protein Trco_006887 [Trichoderma cornu-damae]